MTGDVGTDLCLLLLPDEVVVDGLLRLVLAVDGFEPDLRAGHAVDALLDGGDLRLGLVELDVQRALTAVLAGGVLAVIALIAGIVLLGNGAATPAKPNRRGTKRKGARAAAPA